MPVRILVLTRELSLLHGLWSTAESNGWKVESAEHSWEILRRMRTPGAYDLLLLDTAHFQNDVLDLLRTVCQEPMAAPVLVICRSEDVQGKTEAARLGAKVMTRPFSVDQLEIELRCAMQLSETSRSASNQEQERLGTDDFFLNVSPLMQQVRVQAESLVAQAAVSAPAQTSGPRKHSLKELLHEIKSHAERHAIAAALRETHWNRRQAARLLSVSYRTLLYKIERYRVYESSRAHDSWEPSTTKTAIERSEITNETSIRKKYVQKLRMV